MDWNFKASNWDLSEFEEQGVQNIDSIHGSSSGFGDFSVDLKLGQVGNSGNDSMVSKWKETRVLKMESSPMGSGSSKRARAANNGLQKLSCLVDGCNSDLSSCRDYHRRHKVCELHSKTPEVMINGQKQRFCQQCSRFQSLEEFDEGKRSCRKRLDGHNRRRRKPQPDPLSRSGNFLSNYQGSQLMSYSTAHVYPPTNMVNPTWPGVGPTEATDARHFSQHQQLHSFEKDNLFLGSSQSSSSSNSNYKPRKHFPFFQGDHHHECQPLLRSIALSESNGFNDNMFCDDSLTTRVHDSDCALSLLSSPPTHTSGTHLVQQHHNTSMGPTLNHKHTGFDPMDSVLVSNTRDANNNNTSFPSIFHLTTDGSSSGNQTRQTLPFHWES